VAGSSQRWQSDNDVKPIKTAGLQWLSTFDLDIKEQSDMINLAIIFCEQKVYTLQQCLTGPSSSVKAARAAGIKHVLLELDSFHCGPMYFVDYPFSSSSSAFCCSWCRLTCPLFAVLLPPQVSREGSLIGSTARSARIGLTTWTPCSPRRYVSSSSTLPATCTQILPSLC
jgi:hypothetical protein